MSNEGHEGTLEVLKYADNVIFNFLNNLFNDNLFNNSSIILVSDHGVGMPSIYFPYDFYKIEKRLPMLYIIVNDRKNISYEKQYKYIYENQQTFITGYDIYNTFINIIYGDKYKSKGPNSHKRNSLFNKINQKSRKPSKYRHMSKRACIVK